VRFRLDRKGSAPHTAPDISGPRQSRQRFVGEIADFLTDVGERQGA
jgi:hypothetical protein